MERSEYMRVKLKYFPPDIQEQYKLEELVSLDGFVYVLIDKEMYGLQNAAILIYNNLKKQLKHWEYRPVQGAVGLWEH